MEKGTRVKLNERGVKFHIACLGAHLRMVKWEGRTGTVTRICRDKNYVRVTWDGNRAPSDATLITMLEKIS